MEILGTDGLPAGLASRASDSYALEEFPEPLPFTRRNSCGNPRNRFVSSISLHALEARDLVADLAETEAFEWVYTRSASG